MTYANTIKAIGASLAAVITAAGIAAVNLPDFEGWVLTGYGDPIAGAKLATACAGVTKGIELGRKYTEDDCKSRTAQALIEHGMAISKCLPEELPPEVRASFTDLAYNIGPQNFCGSNSARLANAGNLKGACQAIYGWCKQCASLPGIKRRRDYEVQLCMSGVK
jgi:lysozyme